MGLSGRQAERASPARRRPAGPLPASGARERLRRRFRRSRTACPAGPALIAPLFGHATEKENRYEATRRCRLGLALAIAAMPAHAQMTPLHCGGWNTGLNSSSSRTGADVERCLAQGYGADARDEDGWTPLHFAARSGDAAAIGALINADAQVDARTEGGFTPLHWAAGLGHAAAIEALLGAGAQVDARSEDGHGPRCTRRCSPASAAAIEALLDAGADPKARDATGGESRSTIIDETPALKNTDDLLAPQ